MVQLLRDNLMVVQNTSFDSVRRVTSDVQVFFSLSIPALVVGYYVPPQSAPWTITLALSTVTNQKTFSVVVPTPVQISYGKERFHPCLIRPQAPCTR